MNHIEARAVKTCYDYEETNWIIDGEPITAYLENNRAGACPNFGSLLGLLPAWSGQLISPWENDFVWELVDSPEELNVPILVCEEDCDLSCLVLAAQIHKTKNTISWEKIGVVSWSNFVGSEYNQSGILCLEAYTDQDWERYGGGIAWERYGSAEYWAWVGEHCYEEHIRRFRNYVKPYMQNERNIKWVWSPGWIFEREPYEAMVQQFRRVKMGSQNQSGGSLVELGRRDTPE